MQESKPTYKQTKMKDNKYCITEHYDCEQILLIIFKLMSTDVINRNSSNCKYVEMFTHRVGSKAHRAEGQCY
jgi:hypothetical protein